MAPSERVVLRSGYNLVTPLGNTMTLRTSAHPVATPHAAVIATAFTSPTIGRTSTSPHAAAVDLSLTSKARTAAKICSNDGTSEHGVGKKLNGEGNKSAIVESLGSVNDHATAKKGLGEGMNGRFLRVTHHREPRRTAGGLPRGRGIRID